MANRSSTIDTNVKYTDQAKHTHKRKY